MIKKFTPVSLMALIFLAFSSLLNNQLSAQATSLTESFDVVVPTGWTTINHSTGYASGLGWSQGDLRQFTSYSGADNSYAAANYQSIGRSGNGTINNWLITPELSMTNGGSITFYTRTVPGSTFADRLQVRLSTNGSSLNVGSGTSDIGDFTTLLIDINPTLTAGDFPDTGWTQYTAVIPPGAASGRIAFRYFVTNGGSSGTNSNYIGVDEFSYESVLPVTLLNFTGVIKDNKALLSWLTANEINNKGFEVELSRDNKTFSSIGFVTAVKGSTGVNQYNFTDEKVLSGTNYYRLKQVDNDGAYRYSIVVKLDVQKFAWNIFGNSSNNPVMQLQIAAQSNIAVQVASINGQLIKVINKGKLNEGTYTIPLNLGGSAHGVYVVKLLVDNKSYSKNLMW